MNKYGQINFIIAGVCLVGIMIAIVDANFFVFVFNVIGFIINAGFAIYLIMLNKYKRE